MLDNTVVRRLVTVPGLFVGFALMTLTLPALLAGAAVVDLVRWVRRRTPAMALRMMTFAWGYLLGEVWALITMGAVALLGRRRSIELTYRLQRAWLDWNFELLQLVFGLEFESDGDDRIPPGPFILLSRHASLIDTMLPGRYVVRPHGIRLRYVLKKELLVDPALDIGGNRLPNYFIDRAGDTEAELAALKALASGLGDEEAVLIYPEGTRYSDEKRIRIAATLAERDGPIGEIAQGYRRVLPPRPGGTLALLESTDADVVVLAHRGLEGFARVADIWSGGLVGNRVELRFHRVPRSHIPEDPATRELWLFDLWTDIDAWVVGTPTD